MNISFRRRCIHLPDFDSPWRNGICWIPWSILGRFLMHWWLLLDLMDRLNYWFSWRIAMHIYNKILGRRNMSHLDWLGMHPYSASCLRIPKCCLHLAWIGLHFLGWSLCWPINLTLCLVKLTVWMSHQVRFGFISSRISLLMHIPSQFLMWLNKIIVQLNGQFFGPLPQCIVVLQHFLQHLCKLGWIQLRHQLQPLPHHLIEYVQCVIFIAETTGTQCRCLQHDHAEHKYVGLVIDIVRNRWLLIPQGYEHLRRHETEPGPV